jgi:hypothetical protein
MRRRKFILLFGGSAVGWTRNILVAALTLLLLWHPSVLAQTFKPIDDPEKFAADVVQTIGNGSPNEAARIVIDAVGQPASLSSLQSALQVFDGKKFDFSKKVVDNEISGALRQIVHYSHIEKLGFVYFRFNFKMTGKGWVLANFNFKSETAELLPKDF